MTDDIFDRRVFTNEGPMVRALEAALADRLQVAECVLCANGTLGLELLARVLGLRGEVIVPAFTFVATAHAFRNVGLTPVFCDIDPQTHNVDPSSVRRLVGERTAAICAVHLWGRSAPIAALETIADDAGIPLLFDAAHAFGCRHRSRPVGSSGRAEVFSFHATKIFHTMEGGAVTTHDRELAQALRLARNFGFAGYDHVVCAGTNAKMSEMAAAFGLASLDGFDGTVARARAIHERYTERLASMPGIRLLSYVPDQHNFHYVVLEIDERELGLSRDTLMRALHAENILARRYFYPGCHRMEPYRGESRSDGALENTERVAQRVLLLPGGAALSAWECDDVSDAVRRIVEHREAVRCALERA